ncbi:hypothetical protein, partial [Burkholderia cepacia]|uniref:hypothetical protein n=1 Tax=Burkholderia cepacia TaxID=292 RepID=UPI0011B1CC92
MDMRRVQKIGILISIIGITSACATKPASELPIRSPHQFLSDVKAVADSGDLEDVEFVSKLLRVEYQRNSKVVVIDKDGRSVKGYSVNVTRYAFSKEYYRGREFTYDIFQPNRLLKYTPTEATFLRSRGSRRKVYRIVQFQ